MVHISIDFFTREINSLLIPFNLDVYRYTYPYFNVNIKIKEVDFSLCIVDISYATARTLCFYHLTKKELYFDVLASLLSHLNFIDKSCNNLVLSESRYERLRDFSKSSRIGEMAQGINAFFVAKRLNFPFVIDFDLAKEITQNTLNLQTNGKSPDFLVLDNSLTKIGLFESKGNMHRNITKDLRNAMRQIESVYNPPCFSAKIPVSTQFNNNNDFRNLRIRKARKSSVNYGLLNTSCVEPKDAILLRKLHYASWFYLVGDFKRVETIITQGTVLPIQEINDPEYVLDIETEKGNPIYWVRNPLNFRASEDFSHLNTYLFITSRYFHHGEIKIGIYKRVIDALISSNEEFTIPEEEVSNLRKYPDGTLISIKNNQ